MKRSTTLVALLLVAGCASAPPRQESGAKRIAVVVVQEVDFRDAAMSDVIEFLANGWHCLCHPWIHPTQEIDGDSVTYRFHVDAYDPHAPTGSIAFVKGTNETTFVRLGPMVTFHAEKINVYDLLTQIAHQADGILDINGDEVTIKTKKAEPSSPPYPERAADDLF